MPSPEDRNEDYFLFRLGMITFGIPLSTIREITPATTAKWTSKASGLLIGSIDLRGEHVVVVDLREVFAVEDRSLTSAASIIILHDGRPAGNGLIGIVADSLLGVHAIHPSQIRKTPSSREQLGAEFLCGIGVTAGADILLLDRKKLLSQLEGVDK